MLLIVQPQVGRLRLDWPCWWTQPASGTYRQCQPFSANRTIRSSVLTVHAISFIHVVDGFKTTEPNQHTGSTDGFDNLSFIVQLADIHFNTMKQRKPFSQPPEGRWPSSVISTVLGSVAPLRVECCLPRHRPLAPPSQRYFHFQALPAGAPMPLIQACNQG